MKYRGQFRNGVVVLDEWPDVADGTVVEVEVPDPPKGRNGKPKRPRRGSAEAILQVAGTWAGEPGDMERSLDLLRRMKQAEVAAKQAVLDRLRHEGKLKARAGKTKQQAARRGTPPVRKRRRP